MKKRIYIAVLAAILTLAQSVFVFANRPVHVALDGILQELSQAVLVLDGRAMIDAQDAAAIFGDDVKRVNIVKIGGRDMMAIRDVANLFSLDISWDDENGLVRLSSENVDYSLLAQISGIQPTISMTYQAALNRVNEHDTRLISIEENRIIMERQERDMNDLLKNFDIRGRAQRNYTRLEVELLRARENITIQSKAIEIQEGLMKSGNEMQLRNALADIARAELDIVLLERQLAMEERNFTIVKLLHDMGMESNTNLRDAQGALERTRTNLESLRASLNSSRIALNTLLGLSPSAIVEIQGLSWITTSLTPLEGHIQTQLRNAPNLSLLQLDLDLAEYIFFSYDFLMISNHQANDYRNRGSREDATVVIEMQNNISAAERALDNAKDSLESRIRSLHNDIEVLLEQQSVSKNDLLNAIEDYQEAMLRYMAGMSTWLELERAELAILNHEVALARHEINLGMLTMLYQQPYLALN